MKYCTNIITERRVRVGRMAAPPSFFFGGGARRGGWRSWQLPDLHVAEREQAGMIALHADVAARSTTVVRPRTKLAGFYLRLPVRALELVVHHLLPVEPMLHMVAVDDDAGGVPGAG